MVNIIAVTNKIFDSKTYIVANADNDCIIIDPGFNSENIYSEINSRSLNPLAILCTHGHFDHIAGVFALKQIFNIPFYLHRKELRILNSANFYSKILGINQKIEIVKPDIILDFEYDNLLIGNFNIRSWNLPGHTLGSCVFLFDNNIFTGDMFNKFGIISNEFPGENIAELKKSITQLIRILNNKTQIYPGHGENFSLEEITTEFKEKIKLISNESA